MTDHLTAKALSSLRSTAIPIFRCAPAVGVSDVVDGEKRGGEHLTLMLASGGRSDSGGVFCGTIGGKLGFCSGTFDLIVKRVCIRRGSLCAGRGRGGEG